MTLPPHPFFIALQFLTTIPFRLKSIPDENAMGRSLLYYPLIGAIIGAMLIGLCAGLTSISPPSTAPLIAALVLCLWVLITGGLHLDGLADSVDALMGGLGDRQKTLDIMKDPTSGPMGVVSLILVLLIKFIAIWQLIDLQNWQGLLLAPIGGRALLIVLFLSTPYVRTGGLGELICNHMPRQASYIILALTLGVMAAIMGFNAVWLILIIALLIFALRSLFMARLNGTTGDTAGALVEISEMSVLVVMVFMT